jgi:predicted DNA-binding transcriptional regulator AlpA
MSEMIPLDGYVETRTVEELTGYTRRWIAELIKAGKFPKPDAPGKRGSAHRWRRSTIKRALDEMSAA